MKVFVYGTLKRGYGNNRLLRDATYIGEGFTMGFFDMINAGFPVIVPNENGTVVKGEIYDIGDVSSGSGVSTLQSLDALEGEGVMYDRREIVVIPSPRHDGDRINCSVYIGNPSYWGRQMGSRNPLTDPRYERDGYLEWSR